MSDAPSPLPPTARVARVVLRLLACAAGAMVALFIVLEWVDPPTAPLFLASLGGSAVFLFGLTRAPAAQPRALFGGHIIGAAVGVVCAQLLGDAEWVYVVAIALTLVLCWQPRPFIRRLEPIP